jgi:hypothetical protein
MSARSSPTLFAVAAMIAAAMGLTRSSPVGSPATAASQSTSAAAADAAAIGSKPATAPTSATADGKRGGGANPPLVKRPEGWSKPLRLYGEFFGRESSEDPPDTDTQHAAAALVPGDHGGYELDFMVALVPDPIDSEMPAAFDQALEGIQRGFAKSFFLFDRRWLPWSLASRPPTKERLHRTTPGLLLFRRDGVLAGNQNSQYGKDQGCWSAATSQEPKGHGADRCLLGVFLVGETPKRGIHQAAFVEALRLIQALSPGDRRRHLRLLGPTFSGSLESLRLALKAGAAGGLLSQGSEIEIVTGSATAIETDSATPPGSDQPVAADDRLELLLQADTGGAKVDFSRTVIPDGFLESAALGELRNKMGWKLNELALITEGDTAYGQRLERLRCPKGAQACSDSAVDDALILHFPSHVAAIRNASAAAAAGKPQAAPPEAIAIAPNHTELDLSLADQGLAADSMPELSPLTAPDDEQAMANLLAAISREGISYVGILATDVRDKLYLAERIRQFSPDVTLFTFDGDLLYAHRKMQASMNGMFVISTFHLFTEGSAGLHGADPGDVNHRRQFTSEIKEGIYHAVRALLDPQTKRRELQRDPVLGWISVTSNGSLWPLLNVELSRQDLRLRGFHVLALEDPDSHRNGEHLLISQRADLELLIAALALCALALSLRRAAPPQPRAGPAGEKIPASSTLLSMGLGLLALAGALLLALEVIEYWRPDVFWVDDYPAARAGLWQWPYILGLAAAYLFLVWNLAAVRLAARQAAPALRASAPASGSRRAARLLGWLAAAAAVLAAAWLALLVWFIPGEIEYFELRSRVLSSGLSPVVSLGWLIGALYVWVLLELKRRCVTAWNEVEWPLADSWDPALHQCGKLAEGLRRLVASPAGLRLGTELRQAASFPVDKRLWPALRQEFSRLRSGSLVWIVLPLAMLLALSSLWNLVQPAGETRMYARLFLALVLLALLLSALSFRRFWQVWRQLRRILLRIDETPLKPRFKDLADQVAWKPMRSFGWQLPRFNSVDLSTRCVQALVNAQRPDQPLPEPLNGEFADELRRSIEIAFGADAAGTTHERIASRREIQALLARASRALKSPRPEPEAEELLALRVIAYLRYVFAELRGYLMGGLFPALLLVFAVSAYAFQPKSMISFALLGGLLAAIALTLGVFVKMNRDAVLHLIGGGEAGEVSFDRNFFNNILTYGVLPLLGLVATLVPAVGQVANDWFRPLLRIVGLG